MSSTFIVPGFPRKISVETGRKWLDTLGFTVLQANKGAYFDGHERVDVIEYRNNFLKTMITCGFLHPEQAPTDEVELSLTKCHCVLPIQDCCDFSR